MDLQSTKNIAVSPLAGWLAVWVFALLLLLQSACATYAPKIADTPYEIPLDSASVAHTFYLIGDAGYSPVGGMNPVLQRFRDRLSTAPVNSTALFLGDNIYPKGLPEPGEKDYPEAESHLKAQLKTLEHFPGRPLFIPGNHDWYNGGLEGLKRQERYVEKYLDQKDVFLPEDGCPLEVEQLGDSLVLILLDTEWYLTNWDRKPAINDDCPIKSREAFWNELGSEIKEHAGKTIVLAAHHPSMTYGEHGGQFTLRQQIYPAGEGLPLPVLGTLANLFRKTAGVSQEDLFHKRYRQLRTRLLTLAQFGERVILASGHEHTLQYIVENGIPQIVSGAGAKKGATRLLGGSRFSTGHRGYAVLEVLENGASRVRFYGVDDMGVESLLYATAVHPAPDTSPAFGETRDFPPATRASVYTRQEVDKSGWHKFLWGERYREAYGTEVTVPTVLLDTLYGGVVPVRKGGGQQSKSLRLRHASGREYVMRAMRKQAEQNLQAMAFQDQYVMGTLNETALVSLLEDLYTGAHPFAPYALTPLLDTLGLYHTNPRLVYIPKQPALGSYNADFGDELYMLEEHPSKGHEHLASFGYAPDIESTSDLLENLRKDEKYRVDTGLFIRARLFDMLIGDWDRHQDQWRWAEFEQGDTVVYRPIPRDRDQVFSIMGDGLVGGFLTRTVPAVKKMEGFGPRVRNIRTFNTNPFPLDMALLNQTTLEEWLREARWIRSRIDAGVVEAAFSGFPQQVRGPVTDGLAKTLLARLETLETMATDYYKALQRYVVVQGTDKDDWFELKGVGDNQVSITGYRNIGGEKRKRFFHKVFDPQQTREVWVYGLDDKDRFEVDLPRGNRIRIRIIGGLGKDRYEVKGGKKVSIYDYASKTSEVPLKQGGRLRFTDNYEVNTFQPLKLGSYSNQLLPTPGYNPDDGFRMGLSYTHTRYGFRRNPYTSQYQWNGAYYFATSGFDLNFSAEFAGVSGPWNMLLRTRYTSPNYSRNFFGIGNETPNPEDALGMDYNRVRLRTLEFAPALVWRGPLGGNLRLGLDYQYVTVEETQGRFVNTFYQANGSESTTEYLGAHAAYRYENTDNPAFPTLGMSVGLDAGYRQRRTDPGQHFGYVAPTLSLDHRLIPSGNLVLATRWKAHWNLGNGYAFFQAAQIGASDGPRSYRNQRFSGKSAYYQVTDLRYQFGRVRTGVVPLSLGLFAGYDYGRVWSPGLPSSRWHTSYGGGVFLNGLDLATARLDCFTGAEGVRVSFGLGFTF
ncbi:metallophosphoesterase [Robiginitalea sp. M366]|uniref:metallophosphoesterase n=1 Tax=Robiginitalea aestuariiviva TaxID=3036903 RepID=UPI00240E55EB|nr:metallophosphoesterase [Robiginitalea aestuariiviva]MDG1571805.1 metallophosphoesterase [Robiginitalea aestuariiviva]